MVRALIITVRLHDGCYHGMRDGPPSPARLFQALVAGAGLGGPHRLEEESPALKWLEERDPPVLAAPVTTDGQSFINFVPNNDLDAKGGDPHRIAEIRTRKRISPKLFDARIPFLYAWLFEGDEKATGLAQAICALADRLYQLGRGIDMAWAWGEVTGEEDLASRLSTYPGAVYRPSSGSGGQVLPCPSRGSLTSLLKRHSANTRRFMAGGSGNVAKQLFSQQPKPRFAQVAYESPPSRLVYILCRQSDDLSLAVLPLSRAVHFVARVRDEAVGRLRQAFPHRRSEIERVLVGRKLDGSNAGPTSSRVKIVPLASIGHHYADRRIRRLLIEVPAGCSLRADDINWAFSGLRIADLNSSDTAVILTLSTDHTMLAHYGVVEDGSGFDIWSTVTPAALPTSARRRRVDPARMLADSKNGAERAAEQGWAAAAVAQALRHADVRIPAERIRVQREPFASKGERAEAFAEGTRFAKQRLWHVEITFSGPVTGPLLIGDGRFLGLGVMAPIRRVPWVHTFIIEEGLASSVEPSQIARALRRAVMARVQGILGSGASLSTFYTGHEGDGSPAQVMHRGHLLFTFDPATTRLLIVAPHLADRRSPTPAEVRHLSLLNDALSGLRDLRAGSAGRLALRRSSPVLAHDPLFAPARTWETATPYQVTRHTKNVGPIEALRTDIRTECRRRGLPEPRVTPRDALGVAGVGLIGQATLTFGVAVGGPIILGRSRHLGGGLFTGSR